ncbi:hypothetical protein BC629DRAFT_1590861 [Irpex lacteus]|nr:hypothetical protein BC629DRAFT_1590861 [Irpex lacteus]
MSSSSGSAISRSGSQSPSDGASRHTDQDELKQEIEHFLDSNPPTGTAATELYAKLGEYIMDSLITHNVNRQKAKKTVSNTKQKVGPELYFKFEGQAIALNEKLRDLCNKARKLGSSAGILAASTRLRERLNRVLHAFQNNARSLYPQKIGAHILRVPSPLEPIHGGDADESLGYSKHMRSNTKSDPKMLSKALAEEFRLFSEDVTNLLDCFRQFPQFVDELPDPSIALNLEEFAALFEKYEEDSDPLALEQFLDHTMGDMGDHLESLSRHFAPFTTIGISTVKASQDHGKSNLENQTVVATLFAGIATAMIQVFTVDSPGALDTAVLVLWYTCLIFSIASAVNGLLALSWRQAIYRSPDSHVPWWIRIWIGAFPLAFLVLAVACSFVAIILIGYLPDQRLVTLVVTTVLSAVSCLGLLAVSLWFMCELLVFAHYQGRMWLVDVWRHREELIVMPALLESAINKLPWIGSCEDPSEGGSDGSQRKQDFKFKMSNSHSRVPFWIGQDKTSMTHKEIAKYRWHEGVRRVIQEIRYQTGQPPVLSKQFSHLTSLPMRSIHFQAVERLKTMNIAPSDSDNEQHTGLVRTLRFSPDGKLLFTSNLRLTNPPSYLISVNASMSKQFIPDIVGLPQIDWSPDSKHLLARSSRKLTIWKVSKNDAGSILCNKIIEYEPPYDAKHSIKATAWRGDGKALFIVHGTKVLKVNIHSETVGTRVLDSNDFEDVGLPMHHLEIRGLCVTGDSEWPSRWMICSVKYVKAESEEHTSKPLQKFGLIIWDLHNRAVARESPIYHKMSDITMASDNTSLLISYENRSPSQCWLLFIHESGTRLILQHSYNVPKSDLGALPSIFGGEYDHLVLRAGKAGDIYVWDRDSADLIHCIKAPSTTLGRELTAFSWNRGSSNYMFATGTHTGGVQYWKTRADIPNEAIPKDIESASPIASGQPSPSETNRYSTPRQSFSLDGRTIVSSTSSTFEPA